MDRGKKVSILSLALAAAILGSYAVTRCLISPELGPRVGKGSIKGVVIVAEWPQVPSHLTALRGITQVGKDQARDLASKFGVEGEVTKSDADWKITQGRYEVRIRDTGIARYYDNDMMFGNAWSEEEMPDETTCISIAKDYLSRFQEWTGVHTDVTVSQVVDDVEIRFFRNGSEERLVNNRHVNFDIIIEGRRVVGTQSTTRVYLDNSGNVIGFSGTFWQVEPWKNLPTIDARDALQAALSRRKRA